MAKSEFYRAATIAHAILVIIERDRPDDIADLRARYWSARRKGGIVAAEKAVEVWCGDHDLSSLDIYSAAERFAAGCVDLPSQPEPGPDDEDWPHYDLIIIPGESKQDFINRATRAYKNLHYAGAGDFNSKHVEWLVRKRVVGVGYGTIATEENLSRQRVREAVKNIAAIIGLPDDPLVDNAD
jgi:hypothetical protein